MLETGAVALYTDINMFEQQLVKKVQELEEKLQEREDIETHDRQEADRIMAMLDQNAEQHRRIKLEENEEEQRKIAQERLVMTMNVFDLISFDLI